MKTNQDNTDSAFKKNVTWQTDHLMDYVGNAQEQTPTRKWGENWKNNNNNNNNKTRNKKYTREDRREDLNLSTVSAQAVLSSRLLQSTIVHGKSALFLKMTVRSWWFLEILQHSSACTSLLISLQCLVLKSFDLFGLISVLFFSGIRFLSGGTYIYISI